MTQTSAPPDPTPTQRLIFTMEAALIIVMFKALSVGFSVMDLRSRRSKRQRDYQAAQALG